MTHIASRSFADGFKFLEGPRWRDGALWVSDMMQGEVLRIEADGRRTVLCSLPARPSGIGFLADGTPIVSSMRDRKLMRIGKDGRTTLHADLSALATGDVNELITDAQGRAYVGNFGYDLIGGAPPAPADLLLVEPSGAARVVARDLSFPNGTVIMDAGRTLVIAETWASRLTAFDRAPDGSLSGRRVFADLQGAHPDGICVDVQGGIWVACLGAFEFIRVVDGGAITDRVSCPGRLAVACALGGADGRTLFCCTYAGSLEDAIALKVGGRLEIAQVAVPAASG